MKQYYFSRGSGKTVTSCCHLVRHLYKEGKISFEEYVEHMAVLMVCFYGTPVDEAVKWAAETIQKGEPT